MPSDRPPFENSNPLNIDIDKLTKSAKKITNVCCADWHPPDLSRYFSAEQPGHICPYCKEQALRRLAKEGVRPQLDGGVDVVAQGGKGITGITTRRKARGE